MTTFKHLRPLILIIPLTLSGCFSMPQWRVFKAKVPTPIVKSESQLEAERQAADLVARKIQTPVELKPVAQKLSESLGEPKAPIKDSPKAEDEAVSALRAGMLKQQDQIIQLNRRLVGYQGKDIEGTGINLFAPASGLGFLGLVAACIFVPGFLTFLLFVIRKAYGTIRVLVEKIEAYSEAHPEAAAKLKDELEKGMDEAHKALIRTFQATIVKEGK